VARDLHGRSIDYLRISLTDRCNLRCRYCMPASGIPFKPHDEILTDEEIERLVRLAVAEGLTRVRLTGGEPLVRPGVPTLVGRLLRRAGARAVALTTNGLLLRNHARELKNAGLERVNLSIPSLDPQGYADITRGGHLAAVLDGLDAAIEVGLTPVKVNVVVARSLRQDLLAFARLAADRPVYVRFIEYMPLGTRGPARPTQDSPRPADHVPGREILAGLESLGQEAGLGPLLSVPEGAPPHGWGPAVYFRFAGSQGLLGIITPQSHGFCASCNRLRLTADGRLRPCLLNDSEVEVRRALRGGTDEEVLGRLRQALAAKPAGRPARGCPQRPMSQIGG